MKHYFALIFLSIINLFLCAGNNFIPSEEQEKILAPALHTGNSDVIRNAFNELDIAEYKKYNFLDYFLRQAIDSNNVALAKSLLKLGANRYTLQKSYFTALVFVEKNFADRDYLLEKTLFNKFYLSKKEVNPIANLLKLELGRYARFTAYKTGADFLIASTDHERFNLSISKLTLYSGDLVCTLLVSLPDNDQRHGLGYNALKKVIPAFFWINDTTILIGSDDLKQVKSYLGIITVATDLKSYTYDEVEFPQEQFGTPRTIIPYPRRSLKVLITTTDSHNLQSNFILNFKKKKFKQLPRQSIIQDLFSDDLLSSHVNYLTKGMDIYARTQLNSIFYECKRSQSHFFEIKVNPPMFTSDSSIPYVSSEQRKHDKQWG